MTPTRQKQPSLCPMSQNPFTRDLWGESDAYILANVEPAMYDECYLPKIYRSPDITQEVLTATGPGAYVAHGLGITPGSILLGWYFPATFQQVEASVQITDVGLDHKFFNDPIPWAYLSNGKPFAANLVLVAYPIVEPGRLLVEFWNTSGEELRVQLPFVVLEPRL